MGRDDVRRAALWWVGPLTVIVSVLLVFATLVALALSMLPDAWLPGRVPGATWPIAFVLMITHVAAWAPTVLILTNRALVGKRA